MNKKQKTEELHKIFHNQLVVHKKPLLKRFKFFLRFRKHFEPMFHLFSFHFRNGFTLLPDRTKVVHSKSFYLIVCNIQLDVVYYPHISSLPVSYINYLFKHGEFFGGKKK